jgi:hypothetical protein
VLNDLSALIGSDPEPPIWESAQIEKHPYIPPTKAQKSEFRKYVQSRRPILAFHSGILSYDDWPEYGQLLGFRWSSLAQEEGSPVQARPPTWPTVTR